MIKRQRLRVSVQPLRIDGELQLQEDSSVRRKINSIADHVPCNSSSVNSAGSTILRVVVALTVVGKTTAGRLYVYALESRPVILNPGWLQARIAHLENVVELLRLDLKTQNTKGFGQECLVKISLLKQKR